MKIVNKKININEMIDKYLGEAKMDDYFVKNQKGYKSPVDAYNDGDMFLYMNMLLQVMSRQGKMKVGSWIGEEDPMMGSITWTKKGGRGIQVFITPYWEGSDGVEAAWSDEEGEYGDIGTQRFKATGDMKKDFDAYMKIAKSVLSKIK